MKSYNVNVLKNITDYNMDDVRDISSVFDKIKKGVLDRKIEEIRSTTDKEKINSLKESLPSFTVSATFKDRRIKENARDYNGLIHLDYDGIENPKELKDEVSKLETTFCAFISPSGKGLKVFIKTNATLENHEESFNKLKHLYDTCAGIGSDKSVKDVTRLCYASSDPYLYLNNESIEFDVIEYLKPEEITQQYTPEEAYNYTSNILTFNSGSRNVFTYTYACNSNKCGINETESIDYIAKFSEPDFTYNEIERTVKNAYKRNSSEFAKLQFSKTATFDFETLQSPLISDELYDDLPIENSSNSLSPFKWDNFKHIKRDYNLYRKYLGSKIVILNHTNTAFKKNPDGSTDFQTQINFDDLKLDLKDAGFKITDRDYGSILNSDKIQRIDSLKIFFNQLENNKWDGKDRIKDLISAAKLEGDFYQNHMLIKKWLCTTYAFALRGIDPKTPKKVYSRVVFILFSEQRGFGKTEFFRRIGLIGAIEKATGVSGTEIYAETAGDLPKDHRNFDIDKSTKMIYLLDDINQLLIKGEGKLRSIISQEDFSKRALYKDTNQNLKRRATFAGTTNYKELLRNENENRYMLFTIAERMDFDLLNSLDIMQVWSQVRYEVIKFKDKSMIHADDLKTIMNLSEEYIYHSPLEDTIHNMVEFDPKGRLSFSEIKKTLNEWGVYAPDNKVGGIIKSLAPNDQSIKIKTSEGVRYYKLNWRDRSGTQDMPS